MLSDEPEERQQRRLVAGHGVILVFRNCNLPLPRHKQRASYCNSWLIGDAFQSIFQSNGITAGRVESVHVLFSSALPPSRPPRVARRSRDRSDFLTCETPQRGLPLWADDAGHECALGRGAVSAVVLFRCCCGSLMMRHIQISV